MTHIHEILPKGTQLGVYEIKDDAPKIGLFDITYRAWNHHLKERVEIQEYFPHGLAVRSNDGLSVEFKTPDDQENFEFGLKAFLNQADTLIQIEHPNIATAENILQLNGTAYLIKNCPAGVSLSKLMQSQTAFAETEIKFILASTLNALQTIHAHNSVHGGIKPETIWLNKEGEPVLVDFAAARWAAAARTAKLDNVLAAGYAPIEQYEQASESVHEPGPATDFYALAATMYYCMTHNQPAAAPSRIMALNKGEADPLAPLSQTPVSTYSPELLQAIDWMLQPQYADRPQSVSEILALLKLTQTDDATTPITPITSAQPFKDAASDEPITKKYVWSAIVGVVALIAVGIWLNKSTSDLSDNEAVTTPGASAILETTGDQPFALAAAKPDEESDSDKESARDSQPGSDRITESTSPSTNMSATEFGQVNDVAIDSASDSDQQSLQVDKSLSQSGKPNPPATAVDQDLLRKHLAAAEKAMKRDRLTTPSRDNAYQYYQTVLAMEPDNAAAFAGFKKIVDRYIQFVESAKMKGEPDMVSLYLERAESVLPDDPRLESIRRELADAEE